MMAQSKDFQKKIDRLKNIALFKAFADSTEAMEKIAQLFTTVSVGKDHVVIAEGEEGDELYVIKSGTVIIEKKTMQGDSYTVIELKAEDNVFFGEIALLDPDKRSATVICKTDCEFYVLSREKFIKLGDESPPIGLHVTRELTRIVCNRIRKANSDIITLFDALVEEMAESEGMGER
ncbi:MAG: cyclic nucleotide-binding domain-containing protein [Chitinivibrionales bacterium]|nr:cyclic nucleotide-binding domain-containing protein [Chitinivibrionales bacterium]